MENLEIWNKYRKVPKEALKDFDTGKFQGTDINTMWRIKSLTEQFGPCGKGWYFVPKKMWIEAVPETGERFAFAEIELFVKYDGEWSAPISGNGGNKLSRMTKGGTLSTSDEAYKMAVTDALGVACRNLGFGADIYWENDRTKYTMETTSFKKIQDAQAKKMAELGVNIENVLKKFKVTSISELTYEQAEYVIKAKEKALKEEK